MIKRIFRWFRREPASDTWPAVERRRRTDVHAQMTAARTSTTHAAPQVQNVHPGTAHKAGGRAARRYSKPVIRSRYVREDTGTHETLKIVDESVSEGIDDIGFDPYNSGEFDRARHWERNFRG